MYNRENNSTKLKAIIIALVISIVCLATYMLMTGNTDIKSIFGKRTPTYSIEDHNFNIKDEISIVNNVIKVGKGSYITEVFSTSKDVTPIKITLNGKLLPLESFEDDTNPPGIIVRLLDKDGKFIYNINSLAILEKGEYRLSIDSSSNAEISIH